MDGSVLCYGVIWVLFGIFSPSISVFPIVKTTSLYRITLKYRLTLLGVADHWRKSYVSPVVKFYF